MGLTVDGFPRRKVDLDGLHHGSGNLVFHGGLCRAACALCEHRAFVAGDNVHTTKRSFPLSQKDHAQAAFDVISDRACLVWSLL